MSHQIAKGKAKFLPPILLERYENLNGDALDNLEESIGIQKALETRLLEQLATGESSEAWRILNELIPVYEQADDEQKVGVFNRIKHIASGGLKAYGVRKEIQQAHKYQGELTAILSRCRKEVAETFTLDQYQSMVNTLLAIVQETCDSDTRRLIARKIQQRQAVALPPQKVIEVAAKESVNVVNDIRGNGGVIEPILVNVKKKQENAV